MHAHRFLPVLGSWLTLLVACAPAPAQDPAPAAWSVDGGAGERAGSPDEPPREGQATFLRFGSFNVRRLGLEPEKDLARVAHIIERHFDLVVLLEVMQTEAGGHPGLDALLVELDALGNFDSLITDTPRPNTRSPYAEYYAVLYRPERVMPCPELSTLRYIVDHDGSRDGEGPDLFLREPAIGCFVAQGNEPQQRFDFVLAAYHARWGSGEAFDIEREIAELDQVLQAMRAVRPGERDLFLLGDLNLVPVQVAPFLSASLRTQESGSTLRSDGSRTDRLYDQLWVFDGAASRELWGDAWVLDVRHVGGSADDYVRSVSDHLPIVALARTDLPDDD